MVTGLDPGSAPGVISRRVCSGPGFWPGQSSSEKLYWAGYLQLKFGMEGIPHEVGFSSLTIGWVQCGLVLLGGLLLRTNSNTSLKSQTDPIVSPRTGLPFEVEKGRC